MLFGMLAAAVGLGWFTWRFWQRTQPELPTGSVAAPPWWRRLIPE
jgi:hypothetical protein